jgi:hypothetical protein
MKPNRLSQMMLTPDMNAVTITVAAIIPVAKKSRYWMLYTFNKKEFRAPPIGRK